MKVSVVIPVYGVEKYIARCAKSVLEQTYVDKEIIFVDDASPDNSMTVLNELLKNYTIPVKILHHPVNRGLAAARKTGIEASTGEYIVSVDSDDYSEPRALELLAAKALSSQSDVVRMGCFIEWKNKQIVYNGPWSSNPKEYSRLLISGKTLPGICFHMMRRELYEQADCHFIEGLNYAEDYVVSTRLCWAANSIAQVEQPLYHYDQSNLESMAHTIRPNQIRNMIQAFDVLSDFFKDKPGCNDALQAGRWLKKTEHIMIANRADYALVDTIPCNRPINTSSMNGLQVIAAYLMALRLWNILWLYCRSLEGLLKIKQNLRKACSI